MIPNSENLKLYTPRSGIVTTPTPSVKQPPVSNTGSPLPATVSLPYVNVDTPSDIVNLGLSTYPPDYYLREEKDSGAIAPSAGEAIITPFLGKESSLWIEPAESPNEVLFADMAKEKQATSYTSNLKEENKATSANINTATKSNKLFLYGGIALVGLIALVWGANK